MIAYHTPAARGVFAGLDAGSQDFIQGSIDVYILVVGLTRIDVFAVYHIAEEEEVNVMVSVGPEEVEDASKALAKDLDIVGGSLTTHMEIADETHEIHGTPSRVG